MGNFGPGFSIDINRGGFDLPFGVEIPGLDGFVLRLLGVKSDQYLATKISQF